MSDEDLETLRAWAKAFTPLGLVQARLVGELVEEYDRLKANEEVALIYDYDEA